MKTITREEAMAMIARAMKLTGLDTNVSDADAASELAQFADGAAVDVWAKQAVAATVKSGLAQGREAGLKPTSEITRAETAVIAQRLLIKSKLIDTRNSKQQSNDPERGRPTAYRKLPDGSCFLFRAVTEYTIKIPPHANLLPATLELADCMVTQILMGQDGRAKGVVFVHNGKTYKQKVKLVILSAYVVETQRLLLNSGERQVSGRACQSL